LFDFTSTLDSHRLIARLFFHFSFFSSFIPSGVRILYRMRILFLIFAVFIGCFTDAAHAATNAHHVVLVVWDGMRPDFVGKQYSPTLYSLVQRGVFVAHHRSVYLSATEVNGTAISTGAYPAHDGIIGNSEFRPRIDAHKPIHTETLADVRKGDELSDGQYIRRPTLAEIVREAGRKTAVAGAKPIALLLDRSARKSVDLGANVFAGLTLPAHLAEIITDQYGPFPKEASQSPTRNDWTTSALLNPLWADGVPAFSILWMNEPDFAQHQTSPGSPQSLAAIRNADDNLARVIKALEVKGVLDSTDILVASDHGFSTISAAVDIVEALQKAGFKATREFKGNPAPGEILVVANSGSSLVYISNHDEDVLNKLVQFFQGWKSTGVIFTRKAMLGTFALSEVHLDSDDAPDLLVSLRWTDETNKFGAHGLLTVDRSSYTPGQGSHVSLSPFDMHNTLVAAGPDFRSGVTNSLPSGNVDIAPTILHLLGIKQPKPMDGRVLTEALAVPGSSTPTATTRHLEASAHISEAIWHQYLNVSEVNGVRYSDEGNGSQKNDR
jgi:predicted AlkP superfamily pyrophosphatase or phosphodiesterase